MSNHPAHGPGEHDSRPPGQHRESGLSEVCAVEVLGVASNCKRQSAAAPGRGGMARAS